MILTKDKKVKTNKQAMITSKKGNSGKLPAKTDKGNDTNTNNNNTSTKNKKKKNKQEKNAKLLDEIKALGGDETDMDLLKGVLGQYSDEEVEEVDDNTISSKSKSDVKSLLKDLKHFMKNTLDLNPSTSHVEEVDSDTENLVMDEEEIKENTPQEMTENEKAVSRELEAMLQRAGNQDEDEEDDMPHFGKVIVEPITQWYALDLEKIEKKTPVLPGSSQVESLLSKANTLWSQDIRAYDSVKKPGSTSADKDFIATVLKSGTVTDKVSALTLLVQESPVHAFPLLENQLVHGMAKKKARREALLAIDSIKDLAISCLLPDRKLKYFVDQPLFEKSVTSAHLIQWCFENELKKLYFEYVSILEEMSKDPLPHIKLKVLAIIYELLASKPEQEQNLLALLVNKLGDQDRKVASKACYLLSQLVIRHPSMKGIVTKEVERLIFRPNIGIRAQYYAVTFLNQIILTKKEEDVQTAGQLIRIYFSLFEILVKKLDHSSNEDVGEIASADSKKKPNSAKKSFKGKGGNKKSKNSSSQSAAKPKLDGIDAKMMAALLTGVNRAFPFAKIEAEAFEEQINMLFKIIHVGSFNTAIQALNLLFHVQSGRDGISDRFYNTLYASLHDERLFTSSKQAMYLNLLFKALKEDLVMNRLMAFIKRIVQMCSHAQIPLTCASLFLIGELARSKPALWSLVLQPEDNEDDDEHFADVPLEEDHDDQEADEKSAQSDEEKEKDESLSNNQDPSTSKPDTSSRQSQYDPRKRDPRYAQAQHTCLWDLSQLSSHFHPTVSLYAKTLLQGSPITVPPGAKNYDPLQNHTLSRFLDRFLYKAPKKLKNLHHGSSLMQPRTPGMSAHDDQLVAGGRKKRNAVYEDQNDQKLVPLEDTPVNLVDWNAKTESNVPVDEMFFYHFFKEHQKKTGVPLDPNSKEAMEMDDVDSDQDIPEDEVWEAMQRASGFPKLEDLSDEEDVNLDDDAAAEGGQDLDWETDEEDDAADAEQFESDEDDNDEMLKWAQEEENAAPSDNEIDGIDEDLELSDEDLDNDDMKFMIEDEGDSDFEEEEDHENQGAVKNKKKRKISKAAEKLNKKAADLGYKGDFFKRTSMNDGYMSAFADADEFEALLDAADADGGEGDTIADSASSKSGTQQKRKRVPELNSGTSKKPQLNRLKRHRKN